uniref:ethanolamine ammonia-lyase subunit EutC n=1 Tax=Carboxydothermus ferrireducens TaxID=54265 RepID=UPI0004829E31
MNEKQLKEIVDLIVSKLISEKQQKVESKKESPVVTVPVNLPQEGDYDGCTCKTCCEYEEEEEKELIEDLTAVDIQKEILVPNPVDRSALEYFKSKTPARIGVWRCGPRPLTRTVLRFRADHATAQDAVFSELDVSIAEKYNLLLVQSLVKNKDQYLTRPDLGKKLAPESEDLIKRKCPKDVDVQIVIADGLSSKAIAANIDDILPPLLNGLKKYGFKLGKGILVKYGRMEIMDQIGMLVKAKVVVLLIGERPGLGTAESMSAYLVYNPNPETVVADHNVISNIHKGGTPPSEAGAYLVTVIKKMYDAKLSGVNLKL